MNCQVIGCKSQAEKWARYGQDDIGYAVCDDHARAYGHLSTDPTQVIIKPLNSKIAELLGRINK